MVTDSDIRRIIFAIKDCSAYDFTDYSEKSFTRRIEKIMADNKLTIDELVQKIQKSSDFLEQTVREITVNTTELFRDVEAWHAIKYRILSKFKKRERIMIWHAGCSTGQEVYSMAIMLYELGLFDRTTLVATDLNTTVLNKAAKGVYQYRFNKEYLKNFDKAMRYNPYNYEEVFDVPESKYFEIDKLADTLVVKDFLKERVVFHRHDLVNEKNPIGDTPFDIILCRNVLIYFNYQLQNRIFDLFYQNLATKGFLVLGKHESMLGPMANKYNKRGTFYTKKNMI